MEEIINSSLKQISLGQCIVKAARPNSSIPPLMFALSVELDHLYGSKWLINQLSRLGYCLSYNEITRFKQSVVNTESVVNAIPQQTVGSFTQWVADNVDHNIATIDGHNTFHGMGIIAVTTPHNNYQSNLIEVRHKIPRLNLEKSNSFVNKKCIPIKTYINTAKSILSDLQLKPLYELMSPDTLPNEINVETLWQSAGIFCTDGKRPNWSGFMQHVNTGVHPPKSYFHFMPIIDLKSSDEDCIYSTLSFIAEQACRMNIPDPCVTFDQPLWIKSVEIVKSKNMNMVCRLGGFHMLMSYLGSIGFIMEGSGLSNALETVYGENTVIHMLSGKAYSRAIRGHFLVESALTVKIMNLLLSTDPDSIIPTEERDELQLNISDFNHIEHLYENLMKKETSIYDVIDDPILKRVDHVIQAAKDVMSRYNRTAKLWIQYLDQVQVIKMFIFAERTGNWHLHLLTVEKMLNVFAASGHHNYAKSGRLYLQMMQELPLTNPWLYNCFQEFGYHVVRRSERYWAGLWSDLIIEQVMMRSIKSRGGLTTGRGMTESVRLLWVGSMHRCSEIHEAMASLTNLHHVTSSQHVEMGKSRIKRDNQDFQKIVQYFTTFNPFSNLSSDLRSIFSGLTCKENSKVNCDRADEIGMKMQKCLDNKPFSDAKLKRNDRVVTLISLQKSITIDNEKIQIDPSILFSRLLFIVARTGEPSLYFDYEMTNVPTSLFKDNRMRKTTKSVLKDILLKDVPTETPPPNTVYVIDGGALLHMVIWKAGATYEEVCEQYSRFLNKYGSCIVVFDGYGNIPSIKDHEQLRRSDVMAENIKVDRSMIAHRNQQQFLANSNNKGELISLLSSYLHNKHEIYQSVNDADTLIVYHAISSAKSGKITTVVADDTDILVLLMYHYCKESMVDIYLRSEATKRRKSGLQIYNIRKVNECHDDELIRNMLFVHAWSGCDTTSGIFGHGKGTIMKLIKNSLQFRSTSEIFNHNNVCPSDLKQPGETLMSLSYGGKFDQSLCSLRYIKYVNQLTTTVSKIKPESLPPTSRATYFHSLRVYIQIWIWRHLEPNVMDLTQWGWRLKNEKLEPIMTDMDPAPNEILNIIRCKCKPLLKGQCSNNVCSCRKHGLTCVTACQECRGYDCLNSLKIDNERDSDHDLGNEAYFDEDTF